MASRANGKAPVLARPGGEDSCGGESWLNDHGQDQSWNNFHEGGRAWAKSSWSENHGHVHVVGRKMRMRRGTSSGSSRRTKREEGEQGREIPSTRSWWRPMMVNGDLYVPRVPDIVAVWKHDRGSTMWRYDQRQLRRGCSRAGSGATVFTMRARRRWPTRGKRGLATTTVSVTQREASHSDKS